MSKTILTKEPLKDAPSKDASGRTLTAGERSSLITWLGTP